MTTDKDNQTLSSLSQASDARFLKQEQYILSLLKRTLTVNWQDDPEIQQKMAKLSHILADGVWQRDRRHRL